MEKFRNFIELLYNKQLINNYISNLNSCSNKIILTRSSKIKQTVSCRLWQFQYCILYNIYKIDVSKLNDSNFLHQLCYKYTFILENSIINILNSNKFGPPIIDKKYINYLNNSNNFIKDNEEFNNYYCCIYGSNNFIYHYFVLIKVNNTYFITSSYGSDHVCIPYQIEKLDNLDEFLEFCDSINNLNNEYYKYFFTKFMIKYFLKGGLPKRYDIDTVENNPHLFSKWISSNEGIEKELNFYVNNSYLRFDITILENYNDIVLQALQIKI